VETEKLKTTGRTFFGPPINLSEQKKILSLKPKLLFEKKSLKLLSLGTKKNEGT